MEGQEPFCYLKEFVNADGPVRNIFTEYNRRYAAFMDLADVVIKESPAVPNPRLQTAAVSERNRANQMAFSENDQSNELVRRRDELLAVEDKSVEVLLALGNVSLLLYDFYTASICFSESTARNPEILPGQRYLISVVLTHFKLWKRVIDTLAPVVADLKEPYSRDANFRLGLAYRNTGQLLSADEQFRACYAQPPPWISCFDVIVEISHVWFMGDLASQVLPIDNMTPHTPSVVQQQAFMHLCSDDIPRIDSGIQILSHFRGTARSPDLLYLQGRLHYKRGNIMEAFSTLNRVVAMVSTYELAWCALGNLYLGERQLTDAVACYQRAILSNPDMIEAWLNYATCLELDPELREKNRDFETAFPQRPVLVDVTRRRNHQYVAKIVEPNDRVRFPCAANEIEDVFCGEIPKFDIEVLENTEIICGARDGNDAYAAVAEDEEGVSRVYDSDGEVRYDLHGSVNERKRSDDAYDEDEREEREREEEEEEEEA